MRKKSGFTIVEQAIVLVPEFENLSANQNHKVSKIVSFKIAIKSTITSKISKNVRSPHLSKSSKTVDKCIEKSNSCRVVWDVVQSRHRRDWVLQTAQSPIYWQ